MAVYGQCCDYNNSVLDWEMTFASPTFLSLHACIRTIHFHFLVVPLGTRYANLFLSYHTFALGVVRVCRFDNGNIGKLVFSRRVANSFCFYLRLFDYEPCMEPFFSKTVRDQHVR